MWKKQRVAGTSLWVVNHHKPRNFVNRIDDIQVKSL